jgi:hypothetical protein
MNTTTTATTDWGWHRFATDYISPFGSNFPPAPSVSWWLPTVTTYQWRGDKAVQVYAPTTLTRWEVDDYIARAQYKGYSVEVWDQTPTCLSQQRYASGPCTPLTCHVGRPMRGAAPRYH